MSVELDTISATLKDECGRLNNILPPPKDICVLILKTCKYHGYDKKDFADVIMLKILRR